ncbi:MAG: hypothetical protein OEW36_12390, partial [Hylemonella sp.]|nr:hypothetical protein [Hylemonella sp.]
MKVGAAIAVSVLDIDSRALVRDGAVVQAAGSVQVRSQAEVDSSIKAIGLALAKSNGSSSGGSGSGSSSSSGTTSSDTSAVGAAVAVNVVVTDTAARIGDAQVQAGGQVSVEAGTPVDAGSDMITWAFAGAGAQGSGGGNSNAVAGGIAVSVGVFGVRAEVADGADVNSAADVTLEARNEVGAQTAAAAGAVSLGGSGGAGAGASVSVTVISQDTVARVGQAEVDAAGALTVQAQSSVGALAFDLPMLDDSPLISGLAIGGGVSQSGAAVAGSFVVGVYVSDTRAEIADHAQINQRALHAATPDQDVTVRAQSAQHVVDIAGALAASRGSAGIGAAIDVQVLSVDTDASIGDLAHVRAGGSVAVEAFVDQEQVSVAANAAISISNAAVGGAVSIIVDVNHTRAWIGAGAVVEADGNVVVQAAADTELLAIAGNASVAPSSTAFGISNTTFLHSDSVKAWVAAGAQVTARGNGGTYEVQTGERDADGERTTEAVRGLAVTATSFEDTHTIAAGFSGGSSFGIGGSVTVNVLDETTEAWLEAGVRVNDDLSGAHALQDGLLRASDRSDLFSIAGGAQYGGTGGLGAGVDIGVINKTTRAYLDDGASLKLRNDLRVQAASEEEVFSVAANIGAGGFAVAISAGVYSVNTNTRAAIGDDGLAGPAQVQVQVQVGGDAG